MNIQLKVARGNLIMIPKFYLPKSMIFAEYDIGDIALTVHNIR